MSDVEKVDSVREASCSCGQLRVTTTGEPVRVSVCHCFDCQKRTGSAFGAQARFPSDAVTHAGRAQEYVRTADSGNKITFSFCPDCGGTVFYQLDKLPGFTAVALGCFAQHALPEPTISIYEARRHGWVTLPESCERMD